MRWPFACCGLGDVWPLFTPPPITASLSTATNGRKLFRAAHLALWPWLSPSLQRGAPFLRGLRVAPFSVLLGVCPRDPDGGIILPRETSVRLVSAWGYMLARQQQNHS